MRWEVRPKALLLLCLGALLVASPLLTSLAGWDILRSSVGLVDAAMRNHTFREATGYLAVAAVVFQVTLAARKRSLLLRVGSYGGWRAAHMLAGVGLVLVVVLHTGGRWGVNLNGMLLSAFAVVTTAGLLGKLVEAWMVEQLSRRADRARAAAWTEMSGTASPAGRAQGRATAVLAAPVLRSVGWKPQGRAGTTVTVVRTVWLRAHVLVTAALLVFLLFHVLSVYYF
jgi:hypothetical protein